PTGAPVEVTSRKTSLNYIDSRVSSVSVLRYRNNEEGVELTCTGLKQPLWVPVRHFDWGLTKASAIDEELYEGRADAVAAIGDRDQSHYAYHAAAGGISMPTVFSPATTPRIIELYRKEEAAMDRRLRSMEFEYDPKNAEEPWVYSTNRNDSPNYVENRIVGVGVGLYLGGYLLFVTGLDKPVFLPDEYFAPTTTEGSAVDQNEYGGREAALAAVGDRGPSAFAYYRAAGGMIVPTMFSPASTPKIAEMIRVGWMELARQVSEELTYLAISMVGGKQVSEQIGRAHV